MGISRSVFITQGKIEDTGMTIMPPRTLPQTLIGFFLYNPLGSVLTVIMVILALAILIRFWLDWSTMQVNISLTQLCIGGACP